MTLETRGCSTRRACRSSTVRNEYISYPSLQQPARRSTDSRERQGHSSPSISERNLCPDTSAKCAHVECNPFESGVSQPPP